MKVKITSESWLRQPFFVPRRADSHADLAEYQYLLTTVPGRKHTIRDYLLSLLDSAKERVFVCSFLLGGEAVRDALRRAAKRLRGHVYVITALDEKLLERSLDLELEVDENALRRDRKNFEALTRHGVYVRGAESCHAKFCVVDEHSALVCSANFDPNGLALDEDGARPCGELGLRIEGVDRVKPLADLFRHIWKVGCQREAPPSPEGYRISGVTSTQPADLPAPTGSEDVVWTGFRSTSILAGIRHVIDKAQKRLLLASYSFTGMRAKPDLLIDSLLGARKRGVEIELLLRDRSRDLPEILTLMEMGVQVRANRENHAKYAIADGEMGLLFSANFDGAHGLTSGVETGVRLRPGEAREIADWHAQMWRETPSQALFYEKEEDFVLSWPEIRRTRPPFICENPFISGDKQVTDICQKILHGPCFMLSKSEDLSERWLILVGQEQVVELELIGSEMRAALIEQPHPDLGPLPRLLAKGHWQPSIAWLPTEMEINLP
jgi:phosphatidylserine/phosphatidylglycerophosphate/cardiolipin synthase-like enzyme